MKLRGLLPAKPWIAGACLTVLLPGCGEAASLAPREPVRRLGTARDTAKFGGVTRAALPKQRVEPWTIEVGKLPPTRLELAVAARAPQGEENPAARLHCRAELARAGRPPEVTVRFELTADGSAWTESTGRLPAVDSGRLRLACDSADSSRAVTWAQPLALADEAPAPTPLIVLLSLDTLRADHVSGFGAPPGLTPQLERLGREGLRMTATTAESTWTVASHYALFFSRLYGFPVGDSPVISLAEALASRGFVTTALTGGGFMGPVFQFHRGFDRYAEYGTGADDLASVLADAVRWISRLEGAPAFLYLHSYAVHELPPRERAWHQRAGPFQVFVPTRQAAAFARSFYADLVKKADAALGPFLQEMRRQAVRRPVLLVVLADHGEAFLEHGNYRHGVGTPGRASWSARSVTLHDEVIHVPLIVWSPQLVPPGRDSNRPTMLGDVAPSILSAAGAAIPSTMRGEDLWPLWSRRDDDVSLSATAGSVSHTRGSWALRQRRYKLMVSVPQAGERVFGLFDLEADPGEKHDLAAAHPEQVEALAASLRKRVEGLGVELVHGKLPVCPHCKMVEASAFWRDALALGAAPDDETPSGVDAETRERLRDLGYAQ